MKKIDVQIPNAQYPILISTDAFEYIPNYLPEDTTSIMVVTNTTVDALYADSLMRILQSTDIAIFKTVLPDGEHYKNTETLQQIYDQLLQSRCDRNCVLIALGGGVVGDMAGFAAATYMRGIRFIQVPTTLLSQVDSSVGGKTGINHPMGKNMIGAFYQPLAVFINIETLNTLPMREISAGLAEVIKYGLIADAKFFAWCEKNVEALIARSPAVMMEAIAHSCKAKAKIVAMDEKESGVRALLNLGHTFGHAIEASLGYGQWLHGEAVGCGMVQAAELSHDINGMAVSEIARVRHLVQRIGCPDRAPDIPLEDWNRLMQSDKKSIGGKLKFVLMTKIGSAYTQAVDWSNVAEVIRRTTTK